jgi:formate dehydrogenase beta subunit
VPGGMLAVGIPSYRLPRDILNYEIDLVRKLGVEIICNTRVGVDLTLDQIWKDGYKAIFIAGGLHESATMGCEGEDACYFGFMPGVDFLRKFNLGEKVEIGETISVIGGGNVAMDCARSAVRLGVKEVNLIYRRTRNEMPANAAEIRAAEEEGIKFHLLANPVCILEDSGAVSGMECVQMELGEPDASGRRSPVPLVGSEFEIKADTVIPAIGQVADFSFITEGGGLEVTRWGTLVTDPDTMATPVPGIFAGGDAVLGARTVIEAIATANRAAEAIDSYLREGRSKVGSGVFMERFLENAGVYCIETIPEMIGARERLEEAVLPVTERLAGFEEADLGFQCPSEVINEAERCVKCLRLGLAVL